MILGVWDSLRRGPILPKLHEHPFAPRYRQLGRHWHSCYCSFLLAPAGKHGQRSAIKHLLVCKLCGRGLGANTVSYLNILICHSNEVCICVQIFRCSHHSELYRPLVAEGFVGPFSHRPDLLDSCDAVVGNENLIEYKLAPVNAARKILVNTHRSDYRVAFRILNEVLNGTGRRCVEMIAAYEMICN